MVFVSPASGELFYYVSRAPQPETATRDSMASGGLAPKTPRKVSILSTPVDVEGPVDPEALGNGGATRLGRSLGPCMEEYLLTTEWTDIKGRNTPSVVLSP